MLPLPFQSSEVALMVLPPNNFALSPCYLLQQTNLKELGYFAMCNDNSRTLKNQSSSDWCRICC